MGQSLADWLDGNPNVFIAAVGALAALAAFVGALRLQFRTTRYRTATYWLTVAMAATFGTMASAVLHQFLSAPYWSTTLFYAVVLGTVLWRWHVTEGTLSIHSIDTRAREKFYWATVLATFALGTATGDWTASNLHLNYLPSGVLFAGLILLPAIGYLLGANSIVMFWSAYILTRPLGASFADYMDSRKGLHGLGIPHEFVWGGLALVMIVLVSVLAAIERRGTTVSSGEAQLAPPSHVNDVMGRLGCRARIGRAHVGLPSTSRLMSGAGLSRPLPGSSGQAAFSCRWPDLSCGGYR
jgi:uncharacterized membrane-anchored protein